MKRILMICPFAKPNIGGVESHLEKLMGYLSERKYRVSLVAYQPLTTNARGPKCQKDEYTEIHRVSWFGTGWFPKLEPYFPLVFIYLFPGLFLKSLFFYVKQRDEIDVLHAHGFVAAVITKLLVRILPKRAVVSTHAVYGLAQRRLLARLIRWVLKDFDVILAVGEPSRRELIDIGLDQKKINVHPNWVDTDIFVPLNKQECRKALNLNVGDFVVLFLGRLLAIKGALIMLEAAKKTEKDIKFIFVGDGPLLSTIQDSARSNQRIRCYGKVTDTDLAKVYNAADIFVSPVLYDEGFASVYLESLACGTPVITARKGCLPYFLTSEVADLLDVVNAQEILRLLEYYFENQGVLHDKRRLCREYAEEHFGEKNAEVIAGSY